MTKHYYYTEGTGDALHPIKTVTAYAVTVAGSKMFATEPTDHPGHRLVVYADAESAAAHANRLNDERVRGVVKDDGVRYGVTPVVVGIGDLDDDTDLDFTVTEDDGDRGDAAKETT